MKGLAIVFAAMLAAPLPVQSETERQHGVAERGAQVMPFDLEQTVHVFEPLEDGGLQRVTVKEGADGEQVALIQEHLREEAERFQAGDFRDPARIHGADMPGLTALSAGAERIDVSYTALPAGGEIRYSARDPDLVAAIHRWFHAQVQDHGPHATMHHH